MWGGWVGWGAINVLWTALQERCGYVDPRCGIQKGGIGGRLLTSFELRYRKDAVTLMMLLCWWRCYVEDVATLKMLLCGRCCCVEGVATLMTLLRWRRCYVEDVTMWKMLLRWRCCYVDDVAMLKMLLRWRCCHAEEKRGCAFLPWFSRELWYLIFLWDPWKHWNSIKRNSTGFYKNSTKWRTWTT